ncbi:NAM-associated domain-containing protein [Citrus sinensis]|uniref:NAM-associated domain-containing protein n=1 Tax=Citrus sinensis TaxID=2711 RepID=A0ACB8M211_CITSI|nr:NAM-associated domain-containing protein [Citrus sinensis]
MQSILAAIGKLRGCVRQIENQNPSVKEFKFDHVWPILKDIEKFGDDHSIATPYFRRQSSEFVSSQSDSSAPKSPTSTSPGLSSFSLNINDEHKAKGKRKVEDQNSLVIDTIKEDNRRLYEILKKGSKDRQQNYQIQMIRVQNEKKKFGDDLNSISDPSLCQYFQNEQIKILQKISQQDQVSQNTCYNIGQYFDDIGGSNNDLPDY